MVDILMAVPRHFFEKNRQTANRKKRIKKKTIKEKWK